MNEEKTLCYEPIDNIINKVNNCSKRSVFLCGSTGCGKTTIVNNLEEQENVLNVSLKDYEYTNFINSKIYDLYHIVLLIKNIIKKIKSKNANYSFWLDEYEDKIEIIFNSLHTYYLAYNRFLSFRNRPKNINGTLYNKPEILIDELFEILKNNINLDDIMIVIDNFDFFTSSNFQNLIYNTFQKYVKVLYTINIDNQKDKNKFLNNQDKKDIIFIDYNEDIEILKDILDKNLIYSQLSNENIFPMRIRFILSDDEITYLIKKTNGNINYMKYIMNAYYSRLNELRAFNSKELERKDVYNQVYKESLNIKIEIERKRKRALYIK